MNSRVTFELRGPVHAGGVKPFFWKIAAEAGLGGWTANSEKGVYLCLEGPDGRISKFIRALPSVMPGTFQFKTVSLVKRETPIPSEPGESAFRVLELPDEGEIPEIRPDLAPCSACIAEALDRSSRRYSYPFFNCEKCGPVYSYAQRSPFTRRNNSLTAFPLCLDCRKEQTDPDDSHHFSSETLACPKCGPQFFLLDTYGELVTDAKPLCLARAALSRGEILALQSLYGGFQIFADAFNPETIRRLRRKRQLPHRPLCLMARDVAAVRRCCVCSDAEAALLESPAAPVVILHKKKDADPKLPVGLISPDTDTLAVGLPPTLPEKLLFEHRGCSDSPPPFELLATCGDNRPGKAECLGVDEIFNRLMAFTDKFLCHDLKTPHPCPPSICQATNGETLFVRRARGYVPQAVKLGGRLRKNVAAFGCDAQAAIAFGFRDRIIPSQALGKLEGETETGILNDLLERFTWLCDRVPEVIACDMDVDSVSARAGAALADLHGLPLVTVQTHHAHALACMAENHLTHALAIVMNGGSPGPDGMEWGSECLDARLDGFSRFASFLPPGNGNNRPARLYLTNLLAHHFEASEALLKRLGADRSEYELWKTQPAKPNFRSHSAMLLINAVCAGIGIAPDFLTYPSRCLLILRKYASRFDPAVQQIPDDIASRFQFSWTEENDFRLIDWSETLLHLAREDTPSETEKILYAEAFYRTLAECFLAMAEFARAKTDRRDIVLSGSLFQDPILLNKTEKILSAHNFTVFTHRQLAGDESCVPVGQAYATGLADNSTS